MDRPAGWPTGRGDTSACPPSSEPRSAVWSWKPVWHPNGVRAEHGGDGQEVQFAEVGLGGSPRSDLEAVPERANDTGGRCALWPSGDAHRPTRLSAGAATFFGLAAPFARGARAARAVTLATPQSEGLVRVRGRVCLRTTRPRPLGVASGPAIPPGRVFSAASKAADQPLAARPVVTLSAIAGGPDGAGRIVAPAVGLWFANGLQRLFRSGTGWSKRPIIPGRSVEAALAHVVKSKVEAAHRRNDLFERRRGLMDALVGLCGGPERRHRDLTRPDPTTGLRGHFRSIRGHFGEPTGRQVENGANPGRESSNYLQGCTICAFCPWIGSASVVQKQRGNRLNSRESRSPHNPPHHGLARAVSTLRSPAPWRRATDIRGPRDEYGPRPSTNGSWASDPTR